MARQALRSTPWLLLSVLLCFPFCPPLSGQHVTELSGVLRCRLQNFQFTVNLSLEAENPVLTAWGKSDSLRYLPLNFLSQHSSFQKLHRPYLQNEWSKLPLPKLFSLVLF